MKRVYAVQSFIRDFNGVYNRGPFVNYRLYSSLKKAREVLKNIRKKSVSGFKYEIEAYDVE